MCPDAPAPSSDADCAELSADLPLYVDGELEPAERGRIESHLNHCETCREATELSRQRRSRVQSACALTAPDALRLRLRAALDAADAEGTTAETDDEAIPRAVGSSSSPVPPLPPERPRHRWARPLPLFAGGTAALGLVAWLLFHPRHEDLTRELVARHARPPPLELQSDDPRVLENWLEDKVGFRVRVPRPGRHDLALVGTRLSNVRDHPAVYLQYANGRSPTRRVTLIVYDDPVGAMPVIGEPHPQLGGEVLTARAAGYRVAAWRQDALVYSLVTDEDADVAELVEAAHH